MTASRAKRIVGKASTAEYRRRRERQHRAAVRRALRAQLEPPPRPARVDWDIA